MANLQIVAQRQKDFVKQVEQFKSEKEGWECLWENQMQRFHEKIDSVKPILEKIENNIPAQDLNSLKRKFDQDFSVLAKKMKVDKENLENNAWNTLYRMKNKVAYKELKVQSVKN